MPRDIESEQNTNIRFVKEVQKHPTLYNFELPTYTRKDITDQAWEDVGRTMNMTPSACRERWRNMRAVFMRTLRAPPRGSTRKKKPYYLADVMQFVVPFMRPVVMAEAAKEREKQQTTENKDESKKPIQVEVEHIKLEVHDDELDEWGEVDEEKEVAFAMKRPAQDEEPHQAEKIAKITQPASSSTLLESDHIRSFLNSLLPELNEMNSAQFKNFKRRVLLLIDDIMTEIPASPRRPPDDEYIM